jgi:homoserine kinase
MHFSKSSVTVSVPASTSNLGPGFDSLGLALCLHNQVTVTPAVELPDDVFVREAANAFFEAAGMPPSPFACGVEGEVPRSRGLGSSVTVRLGLLHGLNELYGSGLTALQIYELCCKLEGHPDNAAASAFGGFTICRPDGGLQRHEIDSTLQFVLLIPEIELSTNEARRAVPLNFSRADAVHNLSCAASVAAAIASRRYEHLEGCFSDRIHQPYRGKFLPFLEPVISAGVAAGALGGWLSGSGSTVACAVLPEKCDVEKVAAAMAGACEFQAKTRVVQADNCGVRILKTSAD